MATLRELETRLTTARERNKMNIEQRERLIKGMRDKFGCDSMDELLLKKEQLREQCDSAETQANALKEEVDNRLKAIEERLGIHG